MLINILQEMIKNNSELEYQQHMDKAVENLDKAKGHIGEAEFHIDQAGKLLRL
jgi:soluble cytochrome b562